MDELIARVNALEIANSNLSSRVATLETELASAKSALAAQADVSLDGGLVSHIKFVLGKYFGGENDKPAPDA